VATGQPPFHVLWHATVLWHGLLTIGIYTFLLAMLA
jgi:hypothetical protein